MADILPSDIDYSVCLVCKGFGYTVTPAQKHVICAHCHGYRPVFGILNQHVFAWDRTQSHAAVLQRNIERFLYLLINGLLGLGGVIGIAALAYAGFDAWQHGESFITLFLHKNQYVGLFWVSLLLDALLYYRLERIAFVRRPIPKEFKRMEIPAHVTYDMLSSMHRRNAQDISAYFAPDALEVIDHAYGLAHKLHHHQITPLHILAGIFEEGKLSATFTRLGVQPKLVIQKIARAMTLEHVETGEGLNLSLDTVKIFFYAFEDALHDGQKTVDVAEMFIAIVERDPWSSRIFDELEVSDQTVRSAIQWVRIASHLRERFSLWAQKARQKPKGIMNRAMTARPSPLLQSLSLDYTVRAARGAFFPLIGRIQEMEQLIRVLRQPHGSVLLIGPSGSGKTTLFEGLAERMAAEEVPDELQDMRFVVLDPGALIANATGTGVVEGRIQSIIGEVNQAGNILLGIEDIHHLLNMRSNSGSEDVASILMNAISQGFIKVVATTTTAEYQRYVEMNAPFIRRFQVVNVPEMTIEESIAVCEARALIAESKYKVFFTYKAIDSLVRWSKKYIMDRSLPAKAIDLLDEVATMVNETKGTKMLVNEEDVARVISQKTNIPVSNLTEDERQKLLNLEDLLHEYVVGQDEAIKACAEALRRAREGLREASRPLANFLFVGPSGVGKTELAKAIATVYFGPEHGVLRFDMTEYQDPQSVRKLIGGKGETGLLTERIRLQPYGLILLDELEKAHPDVLNVFLQIMDDGRVTDGLGTTFDLSNTMIIATSNAANQNIYNAYNAGIEPEALHDWLMEKVLPQMFRPELLNRFDRVIACTPLSPESVREIARRMMLAVAKKLKEEKGITLEATEEAIDEIAEKGYHPMYGARPLRRVLQDSVDSALARLLLERNLGRRDLVVMKKDGVMEVQTEAAL